MREAPGARPLGRARDGPYIVEGCRVEGEMFDCVLSVIVSGIGGAFFVLAVAGPGGNSDVGWIGAPIYLGAGLFMAVLAVYEASGRLALRPDGIDAG